MTTRDLTRFRKVYTNKRQKAVYIQSGSTGSDIESGIINFSNSLTGVYTTQTSYISPIVIVTPTDNVNSWISTLVNNGNNWTITIKVSAQLTGQIHIQIAEAS